MYSLRSTNVDVRLYVVPWLRRSGCDIDGANSVYVDQIISVQKARLLSLVLSLLGLLSLSLGMYTLSSRMTLYCYDRRGMKAGLGD